MWKSCILSLINPSVVKCMCTAKLMMTIIMPTMLMISVWWYNYDDDYDDDYSVKIWWWLWCDDMMMICDICHLYERFEEAGAVPGVLVQVNTVDARQWTERITDCKLTKIWQYGNMIFDIFALSNNPISIFKRCWCSPTDRKNHWLNIEIVWEWNCSELNNSCGLIMNRRDKKYQPDCRKKLKIASTYNKSENVVNVTFWDVSWKNPFSI